MADIKFKLNNENVRINRDPTVRLLDVLRDDFGMMGVKEGCGEGECGACSILVDGEVVSSCLMPLGNAGGKEIVTIEGFAKTERYHIL
ncbi:MAG: 2Fe-2S iron-sulfur cluster-binding protein, partial [Clostridia bacterium]|nr:2Fe-2S iron-sulfur cluster-binding protein [Clostridia bacterium]